MKTSILLASTALLSTSAMAALPPTTSTSLEAHLLEVNVQWANHGFVPMNAECTVSFNTEADRIAQHLHLVSERLAMRIPEGLSADQLGNRLGLLDKLNSYADHGTFPQNYVLPYRNPVFIDPHGTACAVGQLIIESGHRDLAERISSAMNLAYLLDMSATSLWPEIASWANDHGFTAEELAWIQPGYPPTFDWTGLGSGTNGKVTVLKALANGDLLVGGEFTEAGGTPANNVAIWNGSTYTALGSGLEGYVTSAVEHNGDLYVGGALLSGNADLAKWNGSSWSFSTVFDGKYPYISALHVHEGLLCAAGAVSGFAGNTDFVQLFDGSQWIPVGSPFNGPVNTLATFNSSLVAGGDFTSIQTSPVPPQILHVAVMGDANWFQLGDGLDGGVRTLLNVNGTLYAGGDIYMNIASVFGLARITWGAPNWEQLMPNHVDYIFPGAGPTYISSLTANGSDVYFGGSFYINQMLTYGSNMARFGGTPDYVTPMALLEAPVNAVEMSGVQLVMGGEFNATLPYVAVLDLTTSIDDPINAVQVQVSPNPVQDQLRVLVPMTKLVSAPMLFDAQGRSVPIRFERRDNGYNANVGVLPAGAYVLQLVTDKGPVNARVAKE